MNDYREALLLARIERLTEERIHADAALSVALTAQSEAVAQMEQLRLLLGMARAEHACCHEDAENQAQRAEAAEALCVEMKEAADSALWLSTERERLTFELDDAKAAAAKYRAALRTVRNDSGRRVCSGPRCTHPACTAVREALAEYDRAREGRTG